MKYKFKLDKTVPPLVQIYVDCVCEHDSALAELWFSNYLEILLNTNSPCPRCHISFTFSKEDLELWEGLARLGGMENLFEYLKQILQG